MSFISLHQYITSYHSISVIAYIVNPDNKVYGANMGPTWDRQDPGGPHVGPQLPCYLGSGAMKELIYVFIVSFILSFILHFDSPVDKIVSEIFTE